MWEIILPVATMIITPIATYKVGKRAVENGLINAYARIKNDLMSEQTKEQLKGLAQGVMQSGVQGLKAGSGSLMPKFSLTDIIGLFALKILGGGDLSQLVSAGGGTPNKNVIRVEEPKFKL